MCEKRCAYCVEYNGDGVEDTGGFDYYSCEYLNNQALEKYGYYFSAANIVEPEDCKYFKCESCIVKSKGEKDYE